MFAPEWPAREILDLYKLFLTLQHTATASDQRNLIHCTILHAAFQTRLRIACLAVIQGLPDRANLKHDIMQEAIRIWIERLLSKQLAFVDEGPDRFGGWLSRVCHSICADARKNCRDLPLEALASAETERCTQLAMLHHERESWERLHQAVEQLDDDLPQKVLVDAVRGVTIQDSASHLGLSITGVFRLREEGAAILRELLADVPVDDY